VFDPTVFTAPRQTITLTSALELTNDDGTTTIIGPPAGVAISGNNLVGVFQVDGGVAASLSGLTITGGSVAEMGGGLYNDGMFTLPDGTVAGTPASQGGGGLYSNGTLTLIDCTIAGNSASRGGGLYGAGTTTLTDCTISGNSASDSGGGVYAWLGATLT